VPSFFTDLIVLAVVVILFSLNLLSGVPSFLTVTFVLILSATVFTVLVWVVAVVLF
jgi:hypothetical protein